MNCLDRPIVILGCPRSGSSMTAGIFAAHGVFTGVCRAPNRYNRKGFFENVRIGKILVSTHGAIVHSGRVAERKKGFRAMAQTAIALDGYSGGPWLWKGSALYWPAWFEFDPIYVACRRPLEDTFRSCRDSSVIFGGRLDDDELRRVLLLHQTEMDKVAGVNVDTKGVAEGDFSTLRRAIEFCGLEFDESKAKAFVDPKLWRH